MDFESSESESENVAGKEDLKYAQFLRSDFNPEQEAKAVSYATEAIGKNKLDKDSGSALKAKLDADPLFQGGGDGSWQVVIGRSFAVSLTYETNYLLFFNHLKYNRSVLIFKTQ